MGSFYSNPNGLVTSDPEEPSLERKKKAPPDVTSYILLRCVLDEISLENQISGTHKELLNS